MLPYFYQENLEDTEGIFVLDESTSKHCVLVLRMQAGQKLLLTNGRGLKVEAEITEASRKHTKVSLETFTKLDSPKAKFALAIAFTKSNSRNEWLLEKATELGIQHIFPISAKRGEKEKTREDRLKNILISAMLQSQQVFLPELHEAKKLPLFFEEIAGQFEQRFIAHCEEDKARVSYFENLKTGIDTLMLIGPEGDFTDEEISMSLEADCIAVSLGNNRLRTETAGMYACTVFNAKNYA